MDVDSSPISTVHNNTDREARAPTSERSRFNATDSRARSSGRSQSRGRSNPSELLARRQQLLANNGTDSLSWSTGGQQNNNNNNNGNRSDTLAPNESELMLSITNTGRTSATTTDSSVEAKLESLSELLKSHQQQQTNHHDGGQNLQASSAKSIDDVYILLAKKEKDLQLAAELGKVLLEKNDELSKANERITEDYSHKLELLEQDKHRLKRKLDLLDSEYENRLIELQTDCNILKNQLDEQQQLVRQTEKEKSKLIDDLVQQNQRLTSELVEATKSEELLSSQLEQMNERFNNRMSNRQDHVAQLDTLKEEIQIVNQRKLDLERRLKLANNDKSNLNAALDESGDKILLLEKLLNEKDSKLNELVGEVNELRDTSSWLSNELESMLSLNERLVNAAGNDLEQRLGQREASGGLLSANVDNDDDGLHSASQRKRSQLIEQLRELRLKNRSRIKAKEFKLINGIRNANASTSSSSSTSPATPLGSNSKQRESMRRKQNKSRSRKVLQAAAKQQTDNCSSLYDEIESSNRSSQDEGAAVDEDDDDDDDDHEGDEHYEEFGGHHESGDCKELVGEIYLLLQRFHSALLLRKEELLLNQSSNQTTSSIHLTNTQTTSQQHFYSPPNSQTDDSGILADDAATTVDHKNVVDQVTWKRLLNSLKALIEEMPCSTCRLMIAERADYEQLQKLHSKLSEEARKKDDQLLALSMVKTEQETKLANLEERCQLLSNDLSNCDKPKEEIVKLAWKARDEAVERKNAAEISLAKTRIENMQISSQLMEVVQQKGELSQKLAQFEDDIHYITQDSVKAKFTWEEYAEKLRRSKGSQQDSGSGGANSNPLAQLLSFSTTLASTRYASNSGGGGVATATGNGGSNGGNNTNNHHTTTNHQQDNKSSAMDNLVAQPSSLMRNFTSNRFNLRFWQRNSSEKVATTAAAAVDNNNKVAGAMISANNEQKA